MGCTGSVSKSCGNGPQWELEFEWHFAQPMGRPRGIPSLAGQHAKFEIATPQAPCAFHNCHF